MSIQPCHLVSIFLFFSVNDFRLLIIYLFCRLKIVILYCFALFFLCSDSLLNPNFNYIPVKIYCELAGQVNFIFVFKLNQSPRINTVDQNNM